MTLEEKVSNMLLWLKQHESKLPARVVLNKAETIVNTKLYMSTLHSRLEGYWERKSLGHAFKTTYFHGYRIKGWYESNMPAETPVIETPPLDE